MATVNDANTGEQLTPENHRCYRVSGYDRPSVCRGTADHAAHLRGVGRVWVCTPCGESLTKVVR